MDDTIRVFHLLVYLLLSADRLTFSGWMALTVNRGRLVSAAPDRPLGLECTRLLFITWLAMGA